MAIEPGGGIRLGAEKSEYLKLIFSQILLCQTQYFTDQTATNTRLGVN
jgi:hypothetical protein